MNPVKYAILDLLSILFSSARFFKERFLRVSSQEISILAYVSTLFGVAIGAGLMVLLTKALNSDFLANRQHYLTALKSLSLSEAKVIELIEMQRAYFLSALILSPLIAYVVLHLFGGALFVFLWSLWKPAASPLVLSGVMACTSVSLVGMAFYAVPIIGPFISAIMVFINLSRALTAYYQITGFIKIVCILMAMYVCFFLISSTLQLLAIPLAGIINR